jgi:hypothetical protein
MLVLKEYEFPKTALVKNIVPKGTKKMRTSFFSANI